MAWSQILLVCVIGVLGMCLVTACASDRPTDPEAFPIALPDGDWKGSETSVENPGHYEVSPYTAYTHNTRGRDMHPEVVQHGRIPYVYFASNRQDGAFNIYRRQIDSHQITQVTYLKGDEYWPQVSPDGKWLAFGGNRAGNWDIYVSSLAQPDLPPRRITSGSSDDIHPTWSPDSTHLVFSSFSDTLGDFVLSYVAFGSAADMRDAKAGESVKSTLAFGGTFSARKSNSTTASMSSDSDGYPSISESGHILSAQGTALRGISPDFRPTNGPLTLVFQDYRKANDRWYGLKLFNWAEGSLMLIEGSSDRAAIQPRWSPNGDMIVYTLVREDWNDSEGFPVGGDGFGIVSPNGESFGLYANPTDSKAISDPTWVMVDGLNHLFFSATDKGEGQHQAEYIAGVMLSPATAR